MSSNPVRPLSLALALLLFAGAAQAADMHVSCNVDSDYDFALSDKSVIFTRDSGTPKAVVMRQGRLFVDDQWVTLGAADRERVAAYETQARAAMPLAAEIGRDAADIAFTALGEVAAGFGNDPARTRVKLDKARAQLNAKLAQSISPTHYNSDEMGRSIGQAVKDVMPMLMGDIVSGAISAAFGDEEQRKRLENMDKDIDARIEPRSKALEGKARTLCDKMKALDGIDNALEYRLPSGKPLELLRIKPDSESEHDHE